MARRLKTARTKEDNANQITKRDLLDLIESFNQVNSYNFKTLKQQQAAELEKKYDDYIENDPTLKTRRKIFEKLGRDGHQEKSKFNGRVERFKHLVLAKSVCAETLKEAEALRLEFAKLRPEEAAEDDD